MRRPLRQAGGLLLLVTLAGALAACGGGFSSAAPPPPDQTIHSYVALGDGFTAAPYAGDTVGDDGCLRSKSNYPALVAAELGIDDAKDVSCTRATTEALTATFKPGKGKKAVAPQFDAIDKDTDLVTIGIGIEDTDLLGKMFKVCLAQPCAPGTSQATEVLETVDRVAESFTGSLRAIQAKAPNVYIVVVGYPQLTPPPDSACDAFPTQPTLPDGTDPVTYLIDDLNTKLRSAGRQTGSGSGVVVARSADHELCSAEPWVHDMHAKPGKAIAYHPLAAEPRAVADEVVTQVRER